MRIEITKGKSEDFIRIARCNGETADTRFPKKGPFPHDLVHVVVEETLGLKHAFWGMIASGRHPEEIAALASSLGHSSAAKAHVPAPSIVELIQAERLVECFEAEIWGGPAALDDLQSVADAAFSASRVPRIALTEAAVSDIRAGLARLGAEWNALPSGGTLACDWAD
jgi:hypothetical protein